MMGWVLSSDISQACYLKDYRLPENKVLSPYGNFDRYDNDYWDYQPSFTLWVSLSDFSSGSTTIDPAKLKKRDSWCKRYEADVVPLTFQAILNYESPNVADATFPLQPIGSTKLGF